MNLNVCCMDDCEEPVRARILHAAADENGFPFCFLHAAEFLTGHSLVREAA